MLLFVGRIQPLKAPDVVLHAAAALLADDPALRARLRVHVVGAPSGSGLDAPEQLQKLAADLGIADVVRFFPPQPPERLADHYRAADVTVVPSHNESFGLVALEAQACGTPVVAAAVGGLPTAVRDGVSGVLVDGHDPRDYAAAVRAVLARRELLSAGARRHAAQFSWDRTADALVAAYASAAAEMAGAAHRAARGLVGPLRALPGRPGGAMSRHRSAELDAVIEAALRDGDLAHEHPEPGKWLVDLPGTKKLKTVCGLIVGEHALRVEAFVCRQPDENREQLWTFLLQHNARMYGVSYSIDGVGDVYLTGRLPHAAVTPEELDRILGAVLSYADDHFNAMLEIGFGTSIRREWDWRVKRGESLRNLEAFAAFADPARRRRGRDRDRPQGSAGRRPPRLRAALVGARHHDRLPARGDHGQHDPQRRPAHAAARARRHAGRAAVGGRRLHPRVRRAALLLGRDR